VTKENPYEPSTSDDSKPGESGTKFIATPALFVATLILAFVAGSTMWRPGTWIGLMFLCPAAAIIIAASQFGLASVSTSLKSIAIFVGVSVAGYIAFAATCSGVNVAALSRMTMHNFDENFIGIVATVATLLGCLCSFFLSRRFLKGKDSDVPVA